LAETLIIDGNRAGVKKHLAFPVDIILAYYKAPLMDAPPLLAHGMPAALYKIVNGHQHILWCDYQALHAQEIN
jgi:hypothetical protein